jgi:hypothetical protein
MWLPMYPAPPVIRIAIAIALYSLWKRPSTYLKLRNKLPFRRVIKAYAKDNT